MIARSTIDFARRIVLRAASRRFRHCLWAMLALASPAYSEDAGREGAPNQLSSGQSLKISDLEGAKIQVKLVTETLMQVKDGPRFPQTGQSDWNIAVEPGPNISWSFQQTSHTPRGTRVGQKTAHSAPLDQPWNTMNGEASWQFTEGTLTFVRSYKNGGANRVSIAFNQDGQNLTCSATIVFAHEQGKNSLTMDRR